MVTSSAVVGSSAISSAGSSTSAIAIMMRCRCPPESWCGYDAIIRSGSGSCTARTMSRTFSRRARGLQVRVRREHLVDLVAAAHDRIQRRHRLLEDHRHPRAAQFAQPGLVGGQQILPGEADVAAGGGETLRQQAHDRVRDDALARARFADEAHDLAAVHGQVDAIHGAAHDRRRGGSATVEVADVEHRRAHVEHSRS